MFGAVREREYGRLGFDGTKHGLVGNPPKRNDHAELLQRRDRGLEKRAAVLYFRRGRFVLRRHAADGIGNHAGHKLKAVTARRLIGACGKTELQQRVIEQFARKVPGKRASGAVCSLKTGRKTHNKKAGAACPKGWNRRVVPLRLVRPERLTKFGKAGTERAIPARLRLYPALLECRHALLPRSLVSPAAGGTGSTGALR